MATCLFLSLLTLPPTHWDAQPTHSTYWSRLILESLLRRLLSFRCSLMFVSLYDPRVTLHISDLPHISLHFPPIVCAMGAGTHVQGAEPLEGWPTVAPAPETYRVWDDDQHAVMTRWHKLGGRGPKSGGPASSACTCRRCPDGWTSLGGLSSEAMCYPSSEGTRRLFPILTPGPPPIKTPYKGFYKDLASICNYIGSITVSWGKALDQSNKAAFDLTRSAMLFKFASVNNLFSNFLGKDNLGKLVDKGIDLNFRQIGDDGTLSLLKRNQLAWEGKLIKKVMSFTSALSIIFSLVGIASSMTTKDPTQAKVDFLVETTNQINQTVAETLARVKFVQVRVLNTR